MSSKLQKLSAITKHTALLAVFFMAASTMGYSQVFPSQTRISAGVEYSFLPLPANENVEISPNAFAGVFMQFRQLYALHLALQTGNLTVKNSTDRESHPTLGFTYDLFLNLYRSDPPAFFTPVAALSFSKQWSLIKSQDTTVKRVMNDASDWQFKAFAGADFALWQNLHIKSLGGVAVLLADNDYYESRVFPLVRISTDFWF